jgi:hypothetical protein
MFLNSYLSRTEQSTGGGGGRSCCSHAEASSKKQAQNAVDVRAIAFTTKK